MAYFPSLLFSIVSFFCTSDTDCEPMNGVCFFGSGSNTQNGYCGCPIGLYWDMDHSLCKEDTDTGSIIGFDTPGGVYFQEDEAVCRLTPRLTSGQWNCSNTYHTCHYVDGNFHLMALVGEENSIATATLSELRWDTTLWRCTSEASRPSIVGYPVNTDFPFWDNSFIPELDNETFCDPDYPSAVSIFQIETLSDFDSTLTGSLSSCSLHIHCPDGQVCWQPEGKCYAGLNQIWNPVSRVAIGVPHSLHAYGVWIDGGYKRMYTRLSNHFFENTTHILFAKTPEDVLDNLIDTDKRVAISGSFWWHAKNEHSHHHIPDERYDPVINSTLDSEIEKAREINDGNSSYCNGNGQVWDSKQCACNIGWYGPFCSLNEEECADERCGGITKGSCEYQLFGCICGHFRSGDNCSVVDCQNGSTYNSTSDTCDCDDQHIGDFCETRRCNGIYNEYKASTQTCVCNYSLVWEENPLTGNCTINLCGRYGIPTSDGTRCICRDPLKFSRKNGPPYCIIDDRGKAATNFAIIIGAIGVGISVLTTLACFTEKIWKAVKPKK